MPSAHYDRVLEGEGFRRIGELHHRVRLTAWWNPAPDKLLQVLVLTAGRGALVKADKSYYLKSVSTEGETWARDIGLLHDYLEGHFPEIRVSLSHFRDVPPELARAEVDRRMAVEAPTLPTPTVEDVAQLQRRVEAEQRGIESMEDLIGLSDVKSDLLTGYVHQQTRTRRAQIDQLQKQVERQRDRSDLLRHLQREYQRKGSAAVYSFGISSNLQVADDLSTFRDALRHAVKELTDLHRFQVTQKLSGGRLNIQVTEAREPALAWIEQWLGGAMNPAQVRRLGREFEPFRQATEDHVIITPDEPIVVDRHVRHAEKHVAARFVSDVMRRLDKTDAAARQDVLSHDAVSVEAMPLALGFRVDAAGKSLGTVAFPLAQMVHVYISGTTGSGKSFMARVLVEEAASHADLDILVLDPRNQSVGLLVPEDRPNILRRYDEFGMKPGAARGFGFRYFAPGLPYAEPPPNDLSALARGRSIVSFKGLDDGQRCDVAGKILDAVFAACNAQESDRPRLLVVLEEAQLFTAKRLDESAREAASHVERALDRIAREGRKFGIVLALVSQTMKDFSYGLASIRQMTTTKIFLRNSDREIGYAADIIGDGRLLVQLPPGTALVHNGNWGVVRVRVRPPYSKVFEPGDDEVRKLVGAEKVASRLLTDEAQKLFSVIEEHGSRPDHPLNMSQAARLAGIGSKRRLLELVSELERKGLIHTRQLIERGRPRIIELVSPNSAARRCT